MSGRGQGSPTGLAGARPAFEDEVTARTTALAQVSTTLAALGAALGRHQRSAE